MKRTPAYALLAPRRRADDRAVTEVLGFILMFALSALILIVSMRAFNAAQANSNDLVAAVELRNVANRISSRVVQAAIVSQEFPHADYEVTLKVPAEIAGYRYSVKFRDRDPVAGMPELSTPPVDPIVYAVTEGENLYQQGSAITGEASTFRIDEVKVDDLTAATENAIVLSPDKVHSSAGAIRVHYWYDMATGLAHLELKEGTT